MSRRLGIAAVAIALLLVGIAAMHAQQLRAAAGSSDATTTIDADQIPPPPPPFAGAVERNNVPSKRYRLPQVVPPKGAPNVLFITTGDVRLRRAADV
jgi:arylsulfatase